MERNQVRDTTVFVSRVVLGSRSAEVHDLRNKEKFVMAFPQGGRTHSSLARESAVAQLSATENALLKKLNDLVREVRVSLWCLCVGCHVCSRAPLAFR